MVKAQFLSFTRVLDVTVRRCARAWPGVSDGDVDLILLTGGGFVGRDRNGAADAGGRKFPILLIGWRLGRRDVSGSMSKWRKAFASLSVKYRVWLGGRVPSFKGPN